MDFSALSRPTQYALIFLLSGAVAVLIKLAGEMEENRLAGLIATAPIKLVIAWTIVGAAAGSQGIADSTTGMFLGVTALLIAITIVRSLSAHLDPAPLIASGLAAWFIAALALEWTARSLES